MSCEIVLRRARLSDWPARAELVQRGFSSYHRDAFVLFYFQELTLQCVVLGGAVLFIFFGWSPSALALLLPIAALVVAAAVWVSHLSLADKHKQEIRKEQSGWVAEYRGPLPGGRPPAAPPVRALTGQDDAHTAQYSQVVGTVSVSEWRGGRGGRGGWGGLDGLGGIRGGLRGGGWLHALAVHPEWCRKGVGRALVEAVRGEARRQGGGELRAACSELQGAARALLRAAGWEVAEWSARRVLGDALTLHVALLALPPPHA